MIYTGKLVFAELFDNMGNAKTTVKKVWEANHTRHPGHCVVTNAHWWGNGPSQIGNYKVNGKLLSDQWPGGLYGFGWDAGQLPAMTNNESAVANFVSTITVLIGGQRQKVSNQAAGVRNATTRTWLGRAADDTWAVEVTTAAYSLESTIDRMQSLGIVDGVVFDGGGSSQWYDGETYIDGDGRTIYSYLLLWFEEKGDNPGPDGPEGPPGVRKGIDVSKWQGNIDWEKVKASGVHFAMLKCGAGRTIDEPQFKYNASECERLGIPYGVYYFSYAYTEDMAAAEAQRCLELIKGLKLSYPVAFDFEYDSVDWAAKQGVKVDKTLASAMARAFLNAIEAAGYYGLLYTNADYLRNYYDADIPKRYDVWLATYKANAKVEDKPAQAGGMWQYSSTGKIDGIEGNVDLNYAYYDYPAIIAKLAPSVPEAPEAPKEEDKPMTYEEEKAAAKAWAIERGISDGERPTDPVTREEVWVMLYRLEKGGEENG